MSKKKIYTLYLNQDNMNFLKSMLESTKKMIAEPSTDFDRYLLENSSFLLAHLDMAEQRGGD